MPTALNNRLKLLYSHLIFIHKNIYTNNITVIRRSTATLFN
jgi:hypothetical protein